MVTVFIVSNKIIRPLKKTSNVMIQPVTNKKPTKLYSYVNGQ